MAQKGDRINVSSSWRINYQLISYVNGNHDRDEKIDQRHPNGFETGMKSVMGKP